MKTLKIVSVVGARPNFMKIAPFVHAIVAYNQRSKVGSQMSETNNSELVTENLRQKIDHFLVHTGQHYDQSMSESFFESLNIPHPEVDLGIGSDSHAEQVGRTMIEFEKVLLAQKPNRMPLIHHPAMNLRSGVWHEGIA